MNGVLKKVSWIKYQLYYFLYLKILEFLMACSWSNTEKKYDLNFLYFLIPCRANYRGLARGKDI